MKLVEPYSGQIESENASHKKLVFTTGKLFDM